MERCFSIEGHILFAHDLPSLTLQSLFFYRCCDEFNGAQCKAVCVEAGMIALRRGAVEIQHEDFMEGKEVRQL